MKRTIVICDDDRIDAHKTKSILREFEASIHQENEIVVYSSGKELISDLTAKKIVPYIIYMDIELNEESGVGIATQIAEICPTSYIVYLTNYLEYAVEVYDSDHLYYVLKRELRERLPKLCERLDRIEKQAKRYLNIALKNSGNMVVLQDDVIYAERKGRQTEVHLVDQIVETPWKLLELEEEWNSEQFIQCHNSFLINMKQIMVYKRDSVEMKDGTVVSISRKFQKAAKEKFLEWSKKQFF